MLSMITGAVGALGGILGEIDRAKRATTLKRMEEDYTRMGAAGMMRDREQNQMVNPQAAAQQQLQAVNAAQANATGAALNQAAGAGASSGDFGNNMAQAIRGSTAANAAAAPFAQQTSQIMQNAQNQELQKQQQSLNINQGIADLSDKISYLEQQDTSPNIGNALISGLTGAFGGANMGNSLGGLLTNRTQTTQPGNMTIPQTNTPGQVSDPIQQGMSFTANPANATSNIFSKAGQNVNQIGATVPQLPNFLGKLGGGTLLNMFGVR